VYEYVIDKGITSEELYPGGGGKVGVCQPFTPVFTISNFAYVPRTDINAL